MAMNKINYNDDADSDNCSSTGISFNPQMNENKSL